MTRRRRVSNVVAKAAISIGLSWAIYWFHGNVWFRLYPALLVVLALSVFVISLFGTPVVEICGRRMGRVLDAREVAYCRRATVLWCVFLSIHLMVTIATVFADEQIWVLYNGCIAYVLLAAMFAGERFVRRSVRRG